MWRSFACAFVALALSACAAVTSQSPTDLSVKRILIAEQMPLPSTWDIPGASHAEALARLQAWADDSGIVIAPAPIDKKNLLGFVYQTHMAGWVLLLNEALPANGRLYTLLHELAHVYAPDLPDRHAGEIFSELVAAQVCDRLGLDVWRQTASYLKTFTTIEEQMRTGQRYAADIDRVVDKLWKAAKS